MSKKNFGQRGALAQCPPPQIAPAHPIRINISYHTLYISLNKHWICMTRGQSWESNWTTKSDGSRDIYITLVSFVSTVYIQMPCDVVVLRSKWLTLGSTAHRSRSPGRRSNVSYSIYMIHIEQRTHACSVNRMSSIESHMTLYVWCQVP